MDDLTRHNGASHIAGRAPTLRSLRADSVLGRQRWLTMVSAILWTLAVPVPAEGCTLSQALQTPADTQVVALTGVPPCLTEELSSSNLIADIDPLSDDGWPSSRSIAWSPSLDAIVALYPRGRTVRLVSIAGDELFRHDFRSFGRRPPALVRSGGDAVLVWNENDLEVVILNPDLRRQRSIPVAGLPDTHRKHVIAQYPDGDLLVRTTMERAADLDAYYARQHDVFLRHDPSTGSSDTLIALAGQRLADMQGITVPAPLSFQTSAVVSGNDLFVFEPSSGALHQITMNGHSVYRYVSDDMLELSDEAKLSMLSLVFGTRAMRDSTLAAEALRLPFPKEAPGFEFLVGDSDGRLWLRRLRSPDLPSEWIVLPNRNDLTSTCRVVGSTGLELIDAVDDSFLGVWADSAARSSIRSYRIDWRER